MMQRQSQAIFLMMILLASLIIIPTETKADESESDNGILYGSHGRNMEEMQALERIPEHGGTGLTTIETPAVNWVAFDSGLGADGYGVAIANLSKSITSSRRSQRKVW